jgi:hypothetical protein
MDMQADLVLHWSPMRYQPYPHEVIRSNLKPNVDFMDVVKTPWEHKSQNPVLIS